MNLKGRQMKIGNITRSLNIVVIGVLLILISFISSSREASAAYYDSNCNDHYYAAVPGAECDEGAQQFTAPTGKT